MYVRAERRVFVDAEKSRMLWLIQLSSRGFGEDNGTFCLRRSISTGVEAKSLKVLVSSDLLAVDAESRTLGLQRSSSDVELPG